MLAKEPMVKVFDSYGKMAKYLSVAKNIETATFTSDELGNWHLHILKCMGEDNRH